MASTEGGVEIEKWRKKPAPDPQSCFDPLTGPMPYQGRELAFKLGLGKTGSQFTKIFAAWRPFSERLALIEINPLVITKQGDLICLDGNRAPMATHCSASLICVKCVTSRRRSREAQAAQWN